MLKDIRKNKLLVISDTAVYREGDHLLAFEPVVRELEALAKSFDEIIWLGCRIHAKSTALKTPESKKIRIVAMPSTSNKTFNAVRVLFSYPLFLFYILRYLPSATHVHTRAPSHPAIIGILFSFFDRSRVYWHKYAGDWVAPSAPATYRLQRKWLRALQFANIRVTVNGKWQNDPGHVYAFENPCFYKNEQQQALISAAEKKFSAGISLLFVGNLNNNKGIVELLDAIQYHNVPAIFKDLYVVGSGPLLETANIRATQIDKLRIHIIGHVNRGQLNEYYSRCHVLMLPSRSEGFPKVIAEAAMYGCIPVVTNISSLSQYITTGVNGFLLHNNSPATIAETLSVLAQHNDLTSISRNATLLSKKFTFEHFIDRIHGEIFNT